MLVEAKSNLARLMATENLVIEQRNVPTAYFDVQSRVLTVPILNGNLSNNLYDLLLGHEVGHALETPADGWHDSVIEHKVNKSILNVCEDVRIEKKIKRRFPGLKPSFLRGYQELMDMDFFEVKGKDLNTLNFIDRVNLYTKGGAAQGINFTAEETKLLREIESTETWAEVVDISKRVQSFMREELEKAKEEGEKIKIRVRIGSEEGNANEITITEEELQELEDAGVEFEFIEEDKTGKEGDLKKDKENTSEVESESLRQQTGGDEASLGSSKEEKLESETDKAFRERERELYDNKNIKSEIVYSNIPKVLTENILVSHKEILKEFEVYSLKVGSIGNINTEYRKNFPKFKNEANKVVSYLVKEFELRKNASQQSRAKISKTGELNMNRIHEYKITDDIFARMTKIPNGKSHGLVMFIDWSGSMQDKIHATIKQLLNLVMFCKKVNIPFDVYAFTSQWGSDQDYYIGSDKGKPMQKPAVGDICLNGGFHLLNLFNHKMTASEYVEMANRLLGVYADNASIYKNSPIPYGLRLGGTPLNHTIVAAFEMIPEFKKANKIDIVNAVFLTDGESGNLGDRYSYYDTNKFLRHEDIQPSGSRRQMFRDPITKATVEVHRAYGSYGNQSAEETTALLKLLKQRANCNLMGFFIAGSRDIRSALESFASLTKKELDMVDRRVFVEQQMVVFRKEKTHVIENVGYDEYYLIGSSSLDTDDDELEVKSNTTRGLVSAFSKYTGGKVTSRIILNRFIKLIA